MSMPFPAQKHRRDVSIVEVLSYVSRDHRFVQLEQVKITIAHFGGNLEAHMKELTQAGVVRRGPAHVATSLYELPLDEWIDVQGSKLRTKDFARAALDLARIRATYPMKG